MLGYSLIKIGVVIYNIFACLGISGIQIGVTIAALGLILALLSPKKPVFYIDERSKKFLFLLCAFAGWMVLSTILNAEPKKGFVRVLKFVGELSLFIALYNISEKQQFSFRRKLVSIILLFATLQSIYGIVQYFTGLDVTHGTRLEPFTRIRGTLGYFNSLGGILGMLLPLSFSYAVFSKQIKQKVLYFISTFLILIALIFTFTRGAWFGALVGIIFVSIYKFRWKAVFILLIIPLLFVFVEPIRTRLLKTRLDLEQERIYMWKTAIELIKQKPFFGHGPGSVKKLIYEKDTQQILKSGHFHVHNIYLNIGIEMGLPAIILFLTMILMLFKYAIFQISNCEALVIPLLIGLAGGLIDFCIHGMVDNVFSGETAYLFWFYSGLIFSMRAEKYKP